jgi:uncharacterized protein (DUF1330 family)
VQVKEIAMAKGYWMSAYRSISDPEKLAACAKLAGPAVEALGGRLLARGGTIKVFGAGIPKRTVIVEFESFEKALAAYKSDTYQNALAVLADGAVRDTRIVEGVD